MAGMGKPDEPAARADRRAIGFVGQTLIAIIDSVKTLIGRLRRPPSDKSKAGDNKNA